MRITNLPTLGACLLFSLHATHAGADVAVIVHPSFPGTALSKADFSRIYLGRTDAFPSGARANAIDLTSGAAREQMLSQLLGKSDSEVAHIWSRLVFSGNAKSLPRVGDEKAMVERVASDPNAIGYVDAKSVSSSVKVLKVE